MDEIIFILFGNVAAEYAAASNQVAFAYHESAHAAAELFGGFNSDAATHAVAIEIEVRQVKMVSQFGYDCGLRAGGIGEILWAFAVAVTCQVKQDSAAACQGRTGSDSGVLVAGSAA